MPDAARIESWWKAIAAFFGSITALVTAWLGIRSLRRKKPIEAISEFKSDSPNKPRILIIDDDRAILGACRTILNGDYYVRDFEFGHDAIQRAIEWHEAGHRLAAAIIDYSINGVSGVDIARIIRVLYPSAKLVFFSGAAILITHEHRKLVDDCWQKPPEDFKRMVDRLLEG